MKKTITLSLMLVLIVGLTTTVVPQTYFEDNFDDAKKSDKKWNPLFGQWDLKDKEYIQSLQLVNSMSLVTDEFWKEEWNDYTFEVKGNKMLSPFPIWMEVMQNAVSPKNRSFTLLLTNSQLT